MYCGNPSARQNSKCAPVVSRPGTRFETGASVIRVLVVDDSALVRTMFGRILSAEPDIEIAYASNGVEALDRMATFLPDVVTLEIDMPEMSGFSCLDRIMIERP